MYAAYELLKRFAGMRWITPGESGEFCVHKSRSIRVPLFSEVQCPKYPIRTTIGNDINAAFWHARNGMQTFVSTRGLLSSSKEAKQMIALGVKSCATGGHILSAILIGGPSDRKSMEKNRDALFAEHPEYFPLVDGKRIKIISAGDPNPCISNPEVLDRMADNLSKLIEGPYTADAYITIGNNDTTRWCECDNCRKLDPPETQRTRGELSDRYWFMVNEIAKRVWVKHPNAKLGGWAYQNFWYAPVRVKPDPRLRVMVSFNNQCWRHACDDAKCPVNKVMVDIYDGLAYMAKCSVDYTASEYKQVMERIDWLKQWNVVNATLDGVPIDDIVWHFEEMERRKQLQDDMMYRITDIQMYLSKMATDDMA
jgi:hypothetical protein